MHSRWQFSCKDRVVLVNQAHKAVRWIVLGINMSFEILECIGLRTCYSDTSCFRSDSVGSDRIFTLRCNGRFYIGS